MSILVTGGCGYIGSHMVWTLFDAGKDVVVIDNLSTGFQWLVPDSVPVIEGDIGDSELVADVMAEHKVDAVIHFAGFHRRARLGHRSARLLSQQYRQVAFADRKCGQGGRQSLYFLLHRRRLWQSGRGSKGP